MNNETQKDYTLAVLSGLGIIASAWEIYTILSPRIGDTFSATLKRLGKQQPFIPAMCGALSRHLWDKDETTRGAFWAGWAMGEKWPLRDGEDEI